MKMENYKNKKQHDNKFDLYFTKRITNHIQNEDGNVFASPSVLE